MLFYDITLKSFPKIKYNFSVLSDKYRVKQKAETGMFELCFVEGGEFIVKDKDGIYICETGHLYPLLFDRDCEIFTETDEPVKLMSVCMEVERDVRVIDSDELDEEDTRRLMKDMLDGNRILIARNGLSVLQFDWLDDYMRKILNCNSGERVGEEANALSIWFNFTSRITKACMDTVINGAVAFPPSSVAYSEMVVSYIMKNYKKKINVSDLARKLDLSPNYLHAIFKQVKGTTIIDYLTLYRMKMAKIYIERFGLRVGVAAEMVGIDDPAYFSRVFKKTFGVSVNELKKQK